MTRRTVTVGFLELHPNGAVLKGSQNQEVEESRILRRILRPDDRVLIGGVGFGAIQSHASLVVGAKNVIGYEPQPHAALMARNIRVSGTYLDVVEKALVIEEGDGEATMYVGTHWAASSLVWGEGGEKTVRTTGINGALRDWQATFLALDVEGLEAELLPAIDDDNFARLRGLLVEIHHHIVDEKKAQRLVDAVDRRGLSVVRFEKSLTLPCSYVGFVRHAS